jgi:PhzF family phenazine biosynthesis protein
MSIPLYHVDAFTDRPFAGNPAAVCLLQAWRDDGWLQAVAADMNLSETAFITQVPDGFHLRWFTPKVEVALCGHATLATAHVLWQEGLARPGQEIHFHTLSGVLRALPADGEIELDFPVKPEEPAESPAGLVESLGVSPRYVGRNQFDYLVEVDTEATLRSLKPDFALLRGVAARGVIVTSRSADPTFDFVSRFFAPASGVDEDPVTGSAHCCLGAFWRKRLNRDDLRAYQASARGGVVRVRVRNDRVFLGGRAVTLSKGSLLV